MDIAVATQKCSVGFFLGLGVLFAPIIFIWFLLRKGYSLPARVFGFAWLVISILIVLTLSYTPNVNRDGSISTTSTHGSTEAPAKPLKLYLSTQVAAHYEENTVAADIEFKGKRIKVSGKITDISTDFLGSPYLVLAGTRQLMGPQFKFDKSKVSALAALKKGAFVNVVCTGQGDIAKVAMFNDCAIAN